MRHALLTGLVLLISAAAQAQPRIAIIIDDLGYSWRHGEAVTALPAAVTCAVIPRTPHGPTLARDAAAHGKEVLIHMPMAALHHVKLDPGGLTPNMDRQALQTTVDQAIQLIPEARGMNNHMGSELTEDATPMHWLMDTLRQHRLFFVDSRTTSHSIAEQVARQSGLATAGRDIFLDNQRNLAAINRQFNKLLRLARQRGQAIAIGHPYPQTIHYLQQVLPLMQQAGIEVVPVSRLLSAPRMASNEAAADKDSDTMKGGS
ncbi:MAG: divergent polysaccharide deacetylase family protein [Alcanivorax sp.]|nr:divergent polysaccharide deacetylase family protein [Alcanivorax sp.]